MNYSNLYYGYNETNIYLDNAASTLSFRKVKETADLFLQNYGSLHRGSGYNSEHSTELYEASREYILERINGQKDKDCVIFTANTTDAINKFCLIYPSGKQKKVLISDIEHTSNVLPWEKHFSVKVFKTNDFIISPEQIKEELDKDNTMNYHSHAVQ